jgi:deoxyribose-phosphate aldolase
VAPLTSQALARYLDHTLLNPDATARDIEKLCAEAREHRFYAVCVAGSRVVQARHWLEDCEVKVVTVAGFPLGNSDPDAKRFEVEAAIDNGAQEIDVVLNIGRLKDGDDAYVLRELRDVVEAADERTVKVLIETSLLTRDEIARACHLVLDTGAEFVATPTGFGPGGTMVEEVKLLRELVGPTFGVKAAGGIRDRGLALALIEAGANRLGSSSTMAIVNPPKSA